MIMLGLRIANLNVVNVRPVSSLPYVMYASRMSVAHSVTTSPSL